MQTMYPAKVNSPTTMLAGGIDAAVDIIPLFDSSVLPAAPNLAAIGIGEDTETILYEVINGNNLETVTRGFQGVAKSWASGTQVARLITAYDLDTLRANLTTHDADPSAHHVKYTDAEAKAQAEAAKLDDHAAPDDNTDLDATAAKHGLMPKADKTKLGGIEANADVTDATNVEAAGAIMHSLATAASDFLVASGADVFIKRTLAQVRTLLNWAADIATHSALTTGIHGVGASIVDSAAARIAAIAAHAGLTVTHGATGAIVGTTNAQILTNKTLIATSNVVEEYYTFTSTTTPIPSGGSLRNFYTLTALAANATFITPSGTPANGNKLIIRIKDNGTARTLGWNAIYRAMEFALPTTTVISKTLYLGFIYNSADSKWDMVAINEEA